MRIICFCLMACSLRAEVIDRIVAAVNDKIITLSDIRQERTIRTILGETAPKDDAAMLQDIIDARLIDEQDDQFPGINVSDQQIDDRLRGIPDLMGVPSSAVRAAIRRRMYAAQFVELRFRQFVRPSDDDVQKYYDSVFVPEAQKRGLNPAPPLDQVQDLVRRNVVEEQVTHDVDSWLDSIRGRSDIEIFK